MSEIKIILKDNLANEIKYNGHELTQFGVTGFGFWVIQTNPNESEIKYKGHEKASVSIPDPPTPEDIAGAIKNAAEAAVGVMPVPPSPAEITKAVTDAIAAAVDLMPVPPSPADIAEAIAAAVKAVQFPLLPIKATIVGDATQPVTATINTPDMRSIGADITANIGGTKQPVTATINIPDISSIGIGGTGQPIKLDPVEVAFRWDKLPTGRLRFSLPSLWFSFTLFKWKIFGFKVEVEGNLVVHSDSQQQQEGDQVPSMDEATRLT